MEGNPNPWLTGERIVLEQLHGTDWEGRGELWLDPLGDVVSPFACTAQIREGELTYTWSKEDRALNGRVTWSEAGQTFRDDFHQAQETPCRPRPGSKAALALSFEYDPGAGPAWGWHILVTVRPTGQLVVQMTNETSWGRRPVRFA